MKDFDLCPKCNKLLTTIITNSKYYSYKSCNSLEHEFMTVVLSGDIVQISYLDFNKKIRVCWRFDDKKIFIYPSNGKRIDIPFFYPDLDDFHKMIDKCKLYITFS